MSEANRSRLYLWFRDQTDNDLAEYFMSCIRPAPLSKLVTEDHLRAKLAVLQGELDAQRRADRADITTELAALRAEVATLREDGARLARSRTAV